MENGEQITIPLYIVESETLVSIGEANLCLGVDGKLRGVMEFEPILRWELDEVQIRLFVVYGSLGERTELGEVRFFRRDRNSRFFGAMEIDFTSVLDSVMPLARSITDQA